MPLIESSSRGRPGQHQPDKDTLDAIDAVLRARTHPLGLLGRGARREIEGLLGGGAPLRPAAARSSPTAGRAILEQLCAKVRIPCASLIGGMQDGGKQCTTKLSSGYCILVTEG